MSEVAPPSDFPAGDGSTGDGPAGAAGQTDTDASASPSLMGRLLTTEEPSDMSASDLQGNGLSPGLAQIAYGFVMMAGTGGMPAVGYVVLGGFIEMQSRASAQEAQQDSGDSEAASAPREASEGVDGPNVSEGVADGPPQEMGPTRQ